MTALEYNRQIPPFPLPIPRPWWLLMDHPDHPDHHDPYIPDHPGQKSVQNCGQFRTLAMFIMIQKISLWVNKSSSQLCVSLIIKLSLFPTLVMIWCQMKSSCSFWNILIRSGHQLLIHWCSVMLAILLNVVFNGVIDFLMIFRACLRTSYYMPSYGIWLGRTKNFLIAQMLSGFVPKFVYNISAIVSNWSSGSDDVNWMPLPR